MTRVHKGKSGEDARFTWMEGQKVSLKVHGGNTRLADLGKGRRSVERRARRGQSRRQSNKVLMIVSGETASVSKSLSCNLSKGYEDEQPFLPFWTEVEKRSWSTA